MKCFMQVMKSGAGSPRMANTSQMPLFEMLESRLLLSSAGYGAAGSDPIVLWAAGGRDGVWVYGPADTATIDTDAGGQFLHVSAQADSHEANGIVTYDPVVVDVLLTGISGPIGVVDLSAADRLTVDARGEITALLILDGDGDLFGTPGMTTTTGTIAGSFDTYEALLDPMTWTLLSAGGNGELDLTQVTDVGVRVTNTEAAIARPTLDVSLDNFRAVQGMDPDPVSVLLGEDFEAGDPNGFDATGPAPVVLTDASGQDSIFIYGPVDDASVSAGTSGQFLHVGAPVAPRTNELGETSYAPVFVDAMTYGLSGLPSNFNAFLRVDALGGVDAFLLMEADGDLFGRETTDTGSPGLAGSFQTYEAVLDENWTLLNAGGDGLLDMSQVIGAGVRLTNWDTVDALYGPDLDVSLDNLRAEYGSAPSTIVFFQEDFEPGGSHGFEATVAGSVVLQDASGVDSVFVYGDVDSVTIDAEGGGQFVRVTGQAEAHEDSAGLVTYDAMVADVMIRNFGGQVGSVNLSAANHWSVSVRGHFEAMLIMDADGDLFSNSIAEVLDFLLEQETCCCRQEFCNPCR